MTIFATVKIRAKLNKAWNAPDKTGGQASPMINCL